MAVNEHIEYLLGTIGDPLGRKKWLDYKLTRPMMNLAEGDFSNKDLRDYDLSDTDLSSAIFFGADLTGADFSDATLHKADFRRATMCNSCLDRADLTMANFQGATLADACIEDANLTEARFQGTDLVGADLAQSDCTHADLRGAILKYTRLTGAILKDANVAEADLTGSVMDDDAPAQLRNFDLAVIDDRKYRMMRSRVQTVAPPKRDTTLDDTARQRVDLGSDTSPGLEGSAGEARHAAAQKPAPDAKRRKDDDTQDDGAEENPFQTRPPLSKDQTVVGPPPSPKEASKPAEPKPEEESTARREAKPYQAANFSFGRKTEDSKPGEKKDGSSPKIEREPSSPKIQREASSPKLEKEGPKTGNPFNVAYVAKPHDLNSDEGCYRVLGVRHNTPYADVTKAYRSKAKLFHPDKVRHMSREEQDFAREQFHLMKKAYEILSRRKEGGNDNIKWVEGVVRRRSPYEQTLDELIKLVEANPGHESLLYNLAYKYAEAGNVEKGIATYERVLIVNPNNEDAHHNLKVLRIQKAFGLSKAR